MRLLHYEFWSSVIEDGEFAYIRAMVTNLARE